MSNNTPYVIDKNLGQNMIATPGDLAETNADGDPIIPLTQEQKYTFDTRGWLLIPGVLSNTEIEEMRDYALRVKHDPESLPEHKRSYIAGPLEKLTDHPVVVGFLNEFLSFPHLNTAEGYGFRMESGSIRYRSVNTGEIGDFNPHNGNGLFRFAVDSHHYQCIPGKAYSGLTRVVWELNPVKKGKGGTLLITGSHKSVYESPNAVQDKNSPLWDTYECPAGSVLFFTEALTHSATPWTDEQNDRVGIFNLYNAIGSKWGTWEPHPQLLSEMPPKRQSLFRDVHVSNNRVGAERYHGGNLEQARNL